MNSDTRNQFQLPDGQFNGNGNQSFLSQESYQNFPQFNNNMMSQVQYTQPNMMTSFGQQPGLGDSGNQAHHLGMQAMNNMQFSNSNPGPYGNNQFLQAQASQMLNNPQFRQNDVQDWKSQLSTVDRQHVISQLFQTMQTVVQARASQQGIPGPLDHSKIELLSRRLEQHIFDTVASRQAYLGKIRDQMINIQSKGIDHLIGGTSVQSKNPTSPIQDPGSPKVRRTNAAGQSSQNSNTNNNDSQLSNFGSTNEVKVNTRLRSSQTSLSESNNSEENKSSQVKRRQSLTQQNLSMSQPAAPGPSNTSPTKKEAGFNPDANQGGDSGQSKNEGNLTTIAGMKVTLLDLTQVEKDSVSAKLEQIRPTFLRIDELIKTLLAAGGNAEFEKVRKLTGMKQMIGAQLEVLDQNIYFIRPDVLQQLLPSLNQYFRYAELLVNGQQPRSIQGQTQSPSQINMMHNSPMMNNGMMGQSSQSHNGRSPHLTPNLMAGSPNVRPGMMVGRPMSNQSQRPIVGMQQHVQQIQILQQRIMAVQQQLAQLQQIGQTATTSEQMQGIHMRQQELMRQQQMMQQQFLALNSQLQQNSHSQPVIRSPSMGRPNRLVEMMGNSIEQQQFNQMQNNHQRTNSNIMYSQGGMGRGQPMQQRPPVGLVPQQLINPMQQQGMNPPGMHQPGMNPNQNGQQQPFSDILGLSNDTSGFQQNDGFQGSPILSKSSPSTSNAVNTPPVQNNVPQSRRGSTPLLTSNVPQSQSQVNGTINPAMMNNSMNRMPPQAVQFGGMNQRPPFAPQQNFINGISPSIAHSGLTSAMGMNHPQMFMNPGMQPGLASQFMGPLLDRPLSANNGKSTTSMQGNYSRPPPLSHGSLSFPTQDPSPNAQAPKSAGDSWAKEFNFGNESSISQSNEINHSKEDGTFSINLDTKLEDYFNLDYEPDDKSQFKGLLEPSVSVNDSDFSFDLPRKKAVKRSREDDNLETEKKFKPAKTIEEELINLVNKYHFTYTLHNTPTAVHISMNFKTTSFKIVVKNRGLYERGENGQLSVSTSQMPDKITEIVKDVVGPKSSKISDIIKIVVSSIKE